ncbi:nuclear transport factor 2 family protein [Niabella terrae]
MKLSFILLAICSSLLLRAQDRDLEAVSKIITAQQLAWNRGDLEGFMEGYLKSDSLVFVGGGEISYGWQAALDRYKKNYPDTAAMGRLDLRILKTRQLNAEWINMVGKWHIRRKSGDIQGSFSLLFQKIRGIWCIVQDHSS